MREVTPLDHVADGRQHYRDLLRTYIAWLGVAGLELRAERDPDFVRYQWSVHMQSEPQSDLSVMAAAVLRGMLTALHALARDLHESGRDDISAPPAATVKFPLVFEAEKWEEQLHRCIPCVTPPDEALLRSLQPFAGSTDLAKALETLYSLSEDGEPRPLSTFVVASFANDGADVSQRTAARTEVIESTSPIALGGSTDVARVWVAMGRDHAGLPQLPAPWSSGFRLDDPPRPDVDLVFRASNGAHVGLTDIKALVNHVEQIVEGFGRSGDFSRSH